MTGKNTATGCQLLAYKPTTYLPSNYLAVAVVCRGPLCYDVCVHTQVRRKLSWAGLKSFLTLASFTLSLIVAPLSGMPFKADAAEKARGRLRRIIAMLVEL